MELRPNKKTKFMAKMAPVLLAEDEQNDILLLQRAFAVAQIRNPLVSVRNGQQAIWYLEGHAPFTDRVQNPDPCLLLLDLKMHLVNGFEVLEWLQHMPELRKTLPVVILTSSDQEEDIRRAFELGASDYLLKPTDLNALVVMTSELKRSWLDPAGERLHEFKRKTHAATPLSRPA